MCVSSLFAYCYHPIYVISSSLSQSDYKFNRNYLITIELALKLVEAGKAYKNYYKF